MKKQLAWILGGASLVGLGMIASLNACSGDTATNDGGLKDSTTKDQSTTDTGTPDTGSQDGGTDTGTGAECGSTPTLHPTEAGTIYCGFSDAGALDCPTGQQCCLGGKSGTTFDPEKCMTFGATCDNPSPDASTSPGIPIECGQNSDCTANNLSGNVCCLQGATAPAVVSGCTYYKATGGTAIKCETASAGACTGSGDVQICSSTADCPTGKTCTPMKWKIYQMGFCM